MQLFDMGIDCHPLCNCCTGAQYPQCVARFCEVVCKVRKHFSSKFLLFYHTDYLIINGSEVLEKILIDFILYSQN